jgi:hypothetical protein
VSIRRMSAFSAARALDRLIGDTGGIGALFARDHRGAGALTPFLQLVDGRGAEGVGGGDHHLLAVGGKARGELADGRGLARAIYAGNQNDKGPMGGIDCERLGDRREHPFHFGGEQRLDLVAGEFVVVARLADCLDDPRRGLDTEIGFDQQIFERLERCRVELLARQVGDAIAEF